MTFPADLQQRGTVLITGATGNTGRSFLHAAERYCAYRDGTRPHQDTPYLWRKVIGCVPPSTSSMDLADFQTEYAEYNMEFPIVNMDKELGPKRILKMEVTPTSQLDLLMDGVEYLILVPTSSIKRVDYCQRWIEVASKHRESLRLVILVSVLGADTGNNRWTVAFHQMERTLIESQLPYAILRCAPFMEMMFAFSTPISEGLLPLPLSTGRFAPLSVIDLATIVCHMINHSAEYTNWIGSVTGDRLVDGEGMAHEASKALGIGVRFENTRASETREILVKQGIEGWLADGVNTVFEMVRNQELCVVGRYNFDRVFSPGGMLSLQDFFSMYQDVFNPFGAEQEQEPEPSVLQAASMESVQGTEVQEEQVYMMRAETKRKMQKWKEFLNDLSMEISKLADILSEERDALESEMSELEPAVSSLYRPQVDQGIEQTAAVSDVQASVEWYERGL